MKRVSVIGLGYIGLPTAILSAESEYDVCGFDINKERVELINAGNPAIFEPEITERLWKVLKSGKFKAYSDLQFADYFIVAVPTPLKSNNKVDLTAVFAAIESISWRLRKGNVVIIESTIPVGTTEKIASILEEHSKLRVCEDFFIAHCPERVLPGKIFQELVENDRVIGGMCQQACEKTINFYLRFVKGFMHITDDKTAEMVKLVENSSRDCQLAFANQVAAMAEEAGLDPYHVIDLANRHPRVKLLKPSCGVGGHCLAVDPYFLIESFPESTQLLQTARAINNDKPYTVINNVLESVQDATTEANPRPRVLCLGLTFKPDVDDIRESPALLIAKKLSEKENMLECRAYDPKINTALIKQTGIELTSTLWEGIAWADIIVILVKHKEFELIREEAFGEKVAIDTCGLFHDIQIKSSKDLLKGATKTHYAFGKSNV